MSRSAVDRELRKLGFGGLNDPNLIPQIAFCIRGHEQFKRQLFSVAPDQRRNAYHSLRPHLRFTPKPLDVYESEMKEMAERMQLPTMREGQIYPTAYKPAEINIDLIAQEAIAQNMHEKHGGLTLKCVRCTETKVFRAKLRKEAEKIAHGEGWRSTSEKSYCQKCVPSRCTMSILCTECAKEEKLRCWDPQDGYASARLRGWVIEDFATCPECTVAKLKPSIQ